MEIKSVQVTFKEKFFFTEVKNGVLYLSNGCYIEATHSYQDCCENNYADFDSIKDTPLMGTLFDSVVFDAWEGGIRINGYAVNCYSEQNGYYSTEITFLLREEYGQYLLTFEGECEMNDQW